MLLADESQIVDLGDLIADDGFPKDLQPISVSPPEVTEAVLEAVSTLTWTPAHLHGVLAKLTTPFQLGFK
jgi:hypothetical protein